MRNWFFGISIGLMPIIRITRIFLQHGIHAHVAIDYCMIVGMYEFEVYDFQILGVGGGCDNFIEYIYIYFVAW